MVVEAKVVEACGRDPHLQGASPCDHPKHHAVPE